MSARGEGPPRSWLRRKLMKVFGPADLGPEHQGNPLVGTKYDPALKKARREARRRSS
ncbi:hypothetical protein CLV35_1356 [Motilibacter peucedani]|uniref:Uncharacterized protein n=1 Tax=Motilibacter peucedani TaxID=598650 RepID=A0A420XS21_9ACTN|nr:hypothetical protein [Motilibacter peucedani]RKS77662.1 hypothetical protein CLV35_1356 [Motilibacter peucedani]